MFIKQQRGSHAFTVVELLVVISVIGVLAAILIPGLIRVRETAARHGCQNNLRQMGLAMHAYIAAYGTFTEGSNVTGNDYDHANVHDMGCFLVELLPFLEQDTLLRAIRASPSAPWTNPNNGLSGIADAGSVAAAGAAHVLPATFGTLRCPSDPWEVDNPRVQNYGVSMGPSCIPGPCPAVQLYYPYCQPGLPVSGNIGGLNDPTYGYSKSPDFGQPGPGSPLDPVLGDALVMMKDVRGMFARFRSSPSALRIVDVSDGLSGTIMLGELRRDQNGYFLKKYVRVTPTAGWGGGEGEANAFTIAPLNYPMNDPVSYIDDYATRYSPCDDPHNLFNYNTYWGFKSWHPGGCNFCFADGSVQFISQNIDQRTYMLLGCRNDGQAIPYY